MALDSTAVVIGRLVSDSVEIAGTACGHVSGGVRITKAVTAVDLKSDYSLTKIGTAQSEVKFTIELSPTELNVLNLAYALGVAASQVAGSTAGKINDTVPGDVTLKFVLDGGASHPDVIFYFHKCSYVGGTTLDLTPGAQLKFPIRFEASAEDVASQIGYFYHLN